MAAARCSTIVWVAQRRSGAKCSRLKAMPGSTIEHSSYDRAPIMRLSAPREGSSCHMDERLDATRVQSSAPREGSSCQEGSRLVSTELDQTNRKAVELLPGRIQTCEHLRFQDADGKTERRIFCQKGPRLVSTQTLRARKPENREFEAPESHWSQSTQHGAKTFHRDARLPASQSSASRPPTCWSTLRKCALPG
jgi:hypothetical protein